MKIVSKIIPVLFAVALVACGGKGKQADYTEDVHGLSDLAGKKVSVLAGSVQELKVDEISPKPEVLRLNSIPEVIEAVKKGRADFFINDTVCLIGSGYEEDGLKVVFSTNEIAGNMAFGFNLGNASLCNEFNEFLARYRADGRLDTAKDRWTKGDVKNVVMEHPKLNPDGELIRIGCCSNFPFTFIQNGRQAGFEVEIVEAFAAETGRNVEFVTIDFSGMIAALATNKIDLIASSMVVTPERSKKVLFSDSYYYCSSVVVARNAEHEAVRKSIVSTVKEGFYNNLIVESRWKIVLDGLLETVIISLCSILLGTLFGGFICWMRLSRRKVLDGIAKVYIEIIRGVPILVLLMLMFYVMFAQSSISARWVAVIAFSMNFGAYVSEMFRTGIQSVDKGQREAGLAMGFTPFMTFVNFIVPQAAKRVLPIFKGEAVSLFKNTSVVGFIAIQDLTKASEIIRARTFDAFFPLIVISILYFILAWLLGKLLDGLAKKIA